MQTSLMFIILVTMCRQYNMHTMSLQLNDANICIMGRMPCIAKIPIAIVSLINHVFV